MAVHDSTPYRLRDVRRDWRAAAHAGGMVLAAALAGLSLTDWPEAAPATGLFLLAMFFAMKAADDRLREVNQG